MIACYIGTPTWPRHLRDCITAHSMSVKTGGGAAMRKKPSSRRGLGSLGAIKRLNEEPSVCGEHFFQPQPKAVTGDS